MEDGVIELSNISDGFQYFNIHIVTSAAFLSVRPHVARSKPGATGHT